MLIADDDVFEGKISILRTQDPRSRPTQAPDLFALPSAPLWPEAHMEVPPGLVVEVVKAAKGQGVTKPELIVRPLVFHL